MSPGKALDSKNTNIFTKKEGECSGFVEIEKCGEYLLIRYTSFRSVSRSAPLPGDLFFAKNTNVRIKI